MTKKKCEDCGSLVKTVYTRENNEDKTRSFVPLGFYWCFTCKKPKVRER